MSLVCLVQSEIIKPLSKSLIYVHELSLLTQGTGLSNAVYVFYSKLIYSEIIFIQLYRRDGRRDKLIVEVFEGCMFSVLRLPN